MALPLLATVLAGLQSASRPFAVRLGVVIAASALGFVGFVFLAIAIDLELMTVMSAAAAAAVTAAVLLLCGFAVIGIGALVGRTRIPRPASAAADPLEDLTALLGLVNALGEKLDLDLAKAAKPMAIGAILGGFALGYSPRLQRWLRRILGAL